MIIKLLPEQAVRQWHEIKVQIAKCFDEDEDDELLLNNILTSIASGRMQCWISYGVKDEEGVNHPNGVALMMVDVDPFTKEKNYLLYAMVRIKEDMTEEEMQTTYAEAFEGATKYAKALGCVNFIAQTRLDHIKKLAEKFDSKIGYTMKWRL